MRTVGLSLIEVIIAVAVVAVAAFAAFMVQANSIRSSARAQTIQRVTKLAESEMEINRQVVSAAGSNQICQNTMPRGYSCNLTIKYCNLSSNALSCSLSGVSTPVARLVDVQITGPYSQNVSLRRVIGQ